MPVAFLCVVLGTAPNFHFSLLSTLRNSHASKKYAAAAGRLAAARRMGCSGSKPEDASPSSSKKAGPGGRSLERENSSWVRPSEANRDARPVAGEATAVPRMRTRSRSVDFSGAGRAILPGQLDAKGPAAPELSQRASRASRGAAGRARSTDDITGAIRVQGYIVAKEEGGRKAGRIAVTSEGNLELRTQLARHQGKHAHFSPEEAEFVLETIGQHFLFKNMTKEQQTRCLQHFERRKLEAKETLTKQGEEGAREFYIVRDGSFEVSVTKTGDFTPTVVASVRVPSNGISARASALRSSIIPLTPLPSFSVLLLYSCASPPS